MVLPGPSTLFDPRNLHGIYSEILFLSLSILPAERFLHHFFQCFAIEPMTVDGKFFDFLDDKLFLPFDDIANPRVVDGWVNITLHHGAPFVVFDIALPSIWRHPTIFTEALLPKITQSQIISIGHQVLNLSPLHLL